MIEIAIDLGGTYTRIYEKNSGLLLEEPTLIAVQQFEDGDYDFYAMGQDAKKVQGKCPENVMIFSPIIDGKIKSVEYTAELLKEFLYKNFTRHQIKNLSCIVLTPCGINEAEREQYRNACYMTGIRKCEIVPKIVCSAVGMDLDFEDAKSTFVVDIGGSICEVASLNNCAILKGCSSTLGGNAIDKAIASMLKNEGLIVGLSSVQKLKEEIATLSEGTNLRYDVVGQDEKTKTQRTLTVSTNNIRKVVEPVIEEIVKVIHTTANVSSPEVASDIVKYGIFVSGGTSNLKDLERYLRKNLGVAVYISDDGGRTAILGAGKLLQDKKNLLKTISNF